MWCRVQVKWARESACIASSFRGMPPLIAASFAALLRKIRDVLALWLIFKPFARQPLNNSCIARKISGPGSRMGYFHVCDPIVPLLLLRISLEQT